MNTQDIQTRKPFYLRHTLWISLATIAFIILQDMQNLPISKDALEQIKWIVLGYLGKDAWVEYGAQKAKAEVIKAQNPQPPVINTGEMNVVPEPRVTDLTR